MSNLTKYRKPMTMLKELENTLFDLFSDRDLTTNKSLNMGNWSPTVNISESDKEYKLTAEIPGMSEEDLEIYVDDHKVTLAGTKKQEKEDEEEDYYHYERSFGRFRRSFSLPCTIDSEHVAATYKEGVLKINLPKTEVGKGKRVKVSKE